jgi:hypothetical protein
VVIITCNYIFSIPFHINLSQQFHEKYIAGDQMGVVYTLQVAENNQ